VTIYTGLRARHTIAKRGRISCEHMGLANKDISPHRHDLNPTNMECSMEEFYYMRHNKA